MKVPEHVISAERERKGLHAWIEEFDLELPIHDRLRLPDQLLAALFGCCPVAFGVHVEPVRGARWFAIDEDPEWHRSSIHPRPITR